MFNNLDKLSLNCQDGKPISSSENEQLFKEVFISEKNSDNLTPLIIASIMGSSAVVFTLLKMYRELKVEESMYGLYNETQFALELALIRGHLSIAKKLLEYGAVPAQRTESTSSSLHRFALASKTRSHDGVTVETVLDMLLESGANIEELNSVGETCLHTCIRFNNYSLAENLLMAGKNLAVKGSIPPLFYCCVDPITHGFADGVPLVKFAKLLLEKGAQINYACSSLNGHRPLTLAISTRNRCSQALAVVELLLQRGCSLTADGITTLVPLQALIDELDYDALEALLRLRGNDIDLNLPVKYDKLPFDYAVYKYKLRVPILQDEPPCFPILRLLGDHGARSERSLYTYPEEQPELVDVLRFGPRSSENRAFAKEYVKNSSCFDYLGEFPHTVLSMCVLYEFPSLVRCCVEKGADVDLEIRPRLCLHEEVHRTVTHEDYRKHSLQTVGHLPQYLEAQNCDSCGTILFIEDNNNNMSQCEPHSIVNCKSACCESCQFFTNQTSKANRPKMRLKAVDIARRKGAISMTNYMLFSGTVIGKKLQLAGLACFSDVFLNAKLDLAVVCNKLDVAAFARLGISSKRDHADLCTSFRPYYDS